MSNIVVGTKVEGNWGAMHPTSDGVVVEIDGSTDIYGEAPIARIKWIDDENLVEQRISVTDIHQPGWTSANSSPIGIFVAEDQ